MATCRSSGELEADRIAKLGAETGRLFHALDNEVVWLHIVDPKNWTGC